jgi:hypothetical protein
MAAGTPTDTDSYWLSQSPVFSHRVQTALMVYMGVVESEIPTGVTGSMPEVVHNARAAFLKQIDSSQTTLQDALARFIIAAASDANVIAAATNASSNYTPITSASLGDTAAAEGGLVTTTLISNAVAAAFDTFVPGI